MPIENLSMVLPRPAKSKYPGSFPLHFEKKLMELYSYPKIVLHPFGGMAEFGFRIDINPEVKPDIIADAHQLPIKNDSVDMVVLDPPFSLDAAYKIYNTTRVHYWTYINEAIRVCKLGGFIVMYHIIFYPKPKQLKWHRRIFVGTQVWHRPRVALIWQK